VVVTSPVVVVSRVVVRHVPQPVQAAMEHVDVGVAADAADPSVARVLPERPTVPGAAERRRPVAVARAPEPVVPERTCVVHRVLPEVVVAVDHRAAVREVAHGVQPDARPPDQAVRAQTAGRLEVERGRELAVRVGLAGDPHELVRLRSC